MITNGACNDISNVLCEDLTPSHVTAASSTDVEEQQLNLDVNSFLSIFFHIYKNRLLPNVVIILRNIGEYHGVFGERHRREES